MAATVTASHVRGVFNPRSFFEPATRNGGRGSGLPGVLVGLVSPLATTNCSLVSGDHRTDEHVSALRFQGFSPLSSHFRPGPVSPAARPGCVPLPRMYQTFLQPLVGSRIAGTQLMGWTGASKERISAARHVRNNGPHHAHSQARIRRLSVSGAARPVFWRPARQAS